MGAKLHFRYGSMNTGKSTQLLQIAYNYEECGKRIMLFTAAVDDRTSVGEISSRLGAHRAATVFDEFTNFFSIPQGSESLSCILIDEAQFLSKEHVQQLHKLAALRNIPVMCFGLRTDFQGNPFEGSTYLLALAEDIQEIKAICFCTRKSTMNLRLDQNGVRVIHGEQVLIGGNSRYRQVCARCFYQS